MKTLEFSTELKKKDYLRFVMYNTYIKALFNLVVMIIFELFMALVLWFNLTYEEPETILTLVSVFGLFLPFILAYTVLLRASAVYKSQNIEGIAAEYIFTEDSITDKNYRGEMRYSYHELHEVRETGRYIIIYINKAMAWIFCKKDLSPDVIHQMKTILVKKIPMKCKNIK